MTDAKEADQEANQGKLSIEGQNNDEQKLQGNEKSTHAKEEDQEADQGKLPNDVKNNIEEELLGNEKSTDAKEADQEADQGKPTNEENNKIVEDCQGNKKPTHVKKGDQEADQGILPNEEQNKTDKQVYVNKMLDDGKEVQTNIMQVEESTNAKDDDQGSDTEADQCKTPVKEHKMLKKRLKEKIKDQVKKMIKVKSPNEGQNNNEDEVQGNLPHGKTDLEEIYNEVEEDGQDKRLEYEFIDAIITNREVPTGKIKYDTSQPLSLLSRKLTNSLKTCFKCNNLNIAFVNLCIPSVYGFSYIKWHFDTSKDVKDDCILGQDYLMDRNTSPLTLYRIIYLAAQK